MRLAIAAAMLVLCGPSWAKEAHCMTRILSDVPAEEAPEQVKSKTNGEFGPVTEIKVSKKTGKMFYCASHSYCYDSNAFELTTPCRIKRDVEAADSEHFIFFTR